MEDPLGFAGRAARVKNEQGVLAVEFGGRAKIADLSDFLVPPHIASLIERNLVFGSPQYDDFIDGTAQPPALDFDFQGPVDIFLERYDRPATEAAVGGDHQFRFAVLDAVGYRLGAESAEHHRMDRADAGASQHGDRRLRHHGQIDQNAIAFADSVLLEHIGEAANFLVQLPVGQSAFFSGFTGLGGFAFPKNRRLVGSFGLEVPVEAVDADVDLAAEEPFGVGGLPFQHLFPRFLPIQ